MEKSIVNRDMELGESGGSNETPLEELRKQAIDHYEELANKCHHFNSFVKDAILSYTPPSAPPPDTVEPTAKEGEDRYKNALLKINEIRNSIIGLQTINWSEHIYPLVAALDEAGIEGKGYPASREYFGTMLERTNKAEADLKEERSKAIQECIDSIEWEGPTIKRIIDELEKLKTKSI